MAERKYGSDLGYSEGFGRIPEIDFSSIIIYREASLPTKFATQEGFGRLELKTKN